MKKLSNFLTLLILMYAVGAAGQCSVSITGSMNVLCFGEATGTATATGAGGTSPYDYVWDAAAGSQTGNTVTGLAAGVYCVTVTDFVGCTATTCVNITQPATPLTANAVVASNYNGSAISCYGASDGCVQAVPSGGTMPYSYAWSPVSVNTQTLCGVAAGNYTVTVTDANLCTATASVNLTQPTAVTATISSSTNVLCQGGNNGTATVVGSGGTVITVYNFLWANGQTTATATGLSAGIHCVTVTDVNGCSGSACVTITQPVSAVNVTASVTSNYNGVPISCNGGNDGIATVTGSGGTGALTYLWGASSGHQTSTTATGLSSGVHCVTATDANGCNASDCVTITLPSAVTATITNITNVSCFGGSDGTATVSGSGGTGGYTYLWGNGTTSATATGLNAFLQVVTVTDLNGCQSSTFINISQPPSSVSVSISNSTNISCFGGNDGSATAIGAGGTPPYNYLWSNNGITTNQNTGLAVGAYCVTATDFNGCTATACVTLTQPSALTLSFSAPDTICSGTTTTITVTPTGGVPAYNYIWYDASVLSTLPNVGAGNHCVTVTDINGCTASACKQINTINFNPSIQDNWSGENPRIFLGDIYNIQTQNTHPNTIYNWTPAAGLSCSTCPNPITTPSITTTYQLTATHLTTGCVSTDNITIEVFTPTTNHVYIDIAPDSTVQENYSHPLWTNGSAFNMAYFTPVIPNYGMASVDTNAHQLIYTSDGTAPQVGDTVMLLICNQICDTTYFYITTASCVWPGDTDNDGIANNMDLLPIGLHHGAIGTTRYNASNDYTCQPSRNWNIGTSGNPTVDIKHIDCDGNGTINDLDTNAIVLNWSQTHIKTTNTITTGIELSIDTATTSPGDTVSLPIILGDALSPVSGYGIAFTIHYDVNGIDTNSVSIDYNNSWLGTIGSNMIGISKDFYNAGQVQVAMTRTDHNSVLGGGTIGHIHFTIKDDVLPKSAFVRLDFEITDIRFIDHLGDTIATIGVPSQILVIDSPVGNSTIENSKNEISVFPNPTGNLLNIQSLNEEIEMIQIMDMTGKLLLEETNIQNLQTSLNMNTLPSGMYILNVQTSSQMQQVRVLKN